MDINDFNNSLSESNTDNTNLDNTKSNKKINKKIVKNTFKGLCILGLSIVVGFGVGFASPIISTGVSSIEKKDKPFDDKNLTNLSTKSNKVIDLVDAVMPSVVTLQTTSSTNNIFNMSVNNVGSGIIFYKTASDVYIVTNYHVIENASNVQVSLNGVEKSVPANLVGKDATHDLAVINVKYSDLKKIGVKNVTIAKFGNSDNSLIGDSVIAIGNSLGEGNTVTLGLISALQRDVAIGTSELPVMQTDAAINPGNSGGPLFNSNGEVIGINTSKIDSTTIEGIGFSIPSNVAKPVIEQIMNNTNPAYLGVMISDVTKEVASYYGINQTGALVRDVVSGGSADKAGIMPYDIITSFNGQPIFSANQLLDAIKSSKSGSTVEIKVIREGKPLTFRVRLQESTPETSF